MPAPKMKSASSNGSATNTKAAKPASSPSASGTATPISKVDEHVDPLAPARTGRPDKAAYDAEQESIKKEIDAVQTKLNALQDKISSISSAGPNNDKKTELRNEWDKIRQEQGKFKTTRGKIMDQLKALNENVQKKIKDLNAAKSKTPFKAVAEVDARIQQLEKQVESGNMKLADEKRALQEISQCKRTRRTVEAFQAEQEAIERDRAAADELRAQLDDPEMKAVSDRADIVKAELDALKREGDEVYSNRNKLFDERNDLRAQLDDLYRRKRESAQTYKDDNDRYWNKVNEDRARRAERARAQRQAEEEDKKKELSNRIREEAEAPAYQAEIEDCQTLIDFFSGKAGGAAPTLSSASATGLPAKSEVAGVPKLELRQVEAAGDGLVARKKKGEDEEAYFVGGKGKAKGRKGGPKPTTGGVPAEDKDNNGKSTSASLQVPLGTLTALLGLSIPPPSSNAEIPRTIEDLKTKKAWFEANQARVTAENVAKAEADIKRILNGGKAPSSSAASPPGEPANGNFEPTSSPAVAPESLSTAVSSGDVDHKLESVKEANAEETDKDEALTDAP